MQLHVTVAASPQARRGPHEAVQLGGGAPTQDTDAVAVAVAPPVPTALMVQVSPALPTTKGVEPEHSTAPLDGEVPVQT